MKFLFVLSSFTLLSLPTFGAYVSSDQHFVVIQNNGTSDSFNLNTQSNRTEYRTEEVPSTCYREVFYGYQTICSPYNYLVNKDYDNRDGEREHHGDHDREHDRDHGPYSYPSPSQVCYQQPVYRTEAYTCSRTSTTSYEVFDHSTTSNISVNIESPPAQIPANGNCGINFNLTGDYLLPTNTCAQYIAIATQTYDGHGYVNNYNYSIKLLDVETVLAPLAGNLQNLQVNGNELTVKTGNLMGNVKYTLKLYVQRRKLLSKDIVLIDRILSANEFTYQAIDQKTGNVHINIQKILGNFEANKKNIIKVSLDVLISSPAPIVNQAIPSLHQEANITIND